MPIYEYEALDAGRACRRCRRRFEVLQALSDPLLFQCPDCGAPVRKVISRCRGAVIETNPRDTQVQSRIKNYESQGLWSHAAELADTYAAKTRDEGLKMRAIDNYEKAGYPGETLEKHSKSKED